MICRCLSVAFGLLVALPVARASGEDRLFKNIRADAGAAPYARDGPRLVTVSPNGDGLRDRAHIRFELAAPATVRLDVLTVRIHPVSIYTRTRRFPRGGAKRFTWAPAATTTPRTYLVWLSVVNRDGSLRRIGPRTVRQSASRDTPVIRVRAVDASFDRPSFHAGAVAALTVATDVRSFRWQVVRAGVERTPTPSDSEFHGRALGTAKRVRVPDRNAPFTIPISMRGLATGIYFVRLTGSDGRTSYAPFVIAPRRLGVHRAAVVLPTYTWQAYNFEDLDGDGWGDTWYAGWLAHSTRLGRHYLGWGMPPYFRRYDLQYVTWLARHHHAVDFLTDDELPRVRPRDYELLVFPSHHEYVTQAELDAVTRFRDAGGNLMFLSANNFFWKVGIRGNTALRTARWRTIGRPEAALLGVEYLANDHGTHKGAWRVRHAGAARWLWRGTRLRTGSGFGRGGVEIDSRVRSSPPGTIVVAEIPHLYGARFTAQMTYYESSKGAKVFSAGAMELTKRARTLTIDRLLTNLWLRMAAP